MAQPSGTGPERPEPIELRGRRLRLRTTTEADRESLLAIRRTPEVSARWRGDDLEAEFDELLRHDDEVWPLTIEDEGGRIVGYVQFAEEEDPEYRHASIDLYIDPSRHRHGLATEALLVLIAHLFDDRAHHRITIDPVADNIAAVACYRGVGFTPVGVMRAYERQGDGTWADGLLMELLDTDPRPSHEQDEHDRRQRRSEPT